MVYSLRVECSNNKLRAIAPVIREHGVEYERSHFKKAMDAGTINLDLVKSVLTDALPSVNVELIKRGSAAEFMHLINTAAVNVIFSYSERNTGSMHTDIVPATMRLDAIRILNVHGTMRANVKKAVIISSLKGIPMNGAVKLEVAKALASEKDVKEDFLGIAIGTIRCFSGARTHESHIQLFENTCQERFDTFSSTFHSDVVSFGFCSTLGNCLPSTFYSDVVSFGFCSTLLMLSFSLTLKNDQADKIKKFTVKVIGMSDASLDSIKTNLSSITVEELGLPDFGDELSKKILEDAEFVRVFMDLNKRVHIHTYNKVILDIVQSVV